MGDRPNSLNDSLDHLFRHHAGQMVSVLSRVFGVRHIDLIEDAVQDALVAAMRKWPYSEVPRNPRAWLTEAAKNRVLDGLRRDAKSSSIDEGDFDLPSAGDRKSTRLNSSHLVISYAVFCLKKKKKTVSS